MAENEILKLTCKACGKEVKCKAPATPGKYSTICTNPDCGAKIGFVYPEASPQPQPNVKFGRLDDGSYRFKCENSACGQSVLVPAKSLHVGTNKVSCPKCQTPHEFEITPTEEDLLKCQGSGCDGVLEKPAGGDCIYTVVCKCGLEYALIIESGKVVKATMKTPSPVSSTKQKPMKLMAGSVFNRKEYLLSKGSHYIGRDDAMVKSDFMVHDKYASTRSIKIDVNENGGSLVYRMTVEKATNPVYHNNRELAVGDIVYLTYGDTIKLGKTLIKSQKAK